METFAEKLKAARAAAGLTQQGMAGIMEIPKRTVEDWERSKSTPPAYVQRFVLNELRQVRCRDCEHYAESEYTESGHYCGLHSAGEEYVEMDGDDFCGYAKPKKKKE